MSLQFNNPRLFTVIGDQSIYFTPSEHQILTHSLTAYECKNKNGNGTILYVCDVSFVPLRKKNVFPVMDIINLEYPYQSLIQILIQNPVNHPLTLVKGTIGYAQQDVSLNDYQTTKKSHKRTCRIHGCLHFELPHSRYIRQT